MEQIENLSAEDLLLAPSGSSLDLHAVAIAILRSKRLILLTAFACAIVAFLYVKRQPVTYQAQVELLPPQTARSTGAAALTGTGIGAENSLNVLGAAVQAKSQVDSFTIILQAWPIQDGMVKKFDLVHAYGAPNATVARYILAGRTTISGTREGFIKIALLDTDKQRSALLANGYVDQAREFLRGLALSEASQRRAFYEGQLASTKEALVKAEEAFRHLQQTSGAVSIDSQATALLGAATSLRSQITAKEVEIEGLRGYSTASNPQVQIAESELAALRGQLAQLESHGQGGYTGRALSSVPGAELEYVRATRELKYQESLYDLMVKQYEGSKLDEARDAPAIQVVEPALVPDHKFGPHKAKAALTGFGVGFFAALAFTLYRYWRAKMTPEARGKWAEFRQALRWSA